MCACSRINTPIKQEVYVRVFKNKYAHQTRSVSARDQELNTPIKQEVYVRVIKN
jgi:hypothetical protein